MRRKFEIEIEDDGNFDWKRATSNWCLWMPTSGRGHNTLPTYVWKEVTEFENEELKMIRADMKVLAQGQLELKRVFAEETPTAVNGRVDLLKSRFESNLAGQQDVCRKYDQAISEIRECLDNSSSCYSLNQDIKNLEARIENLEMPPRVSGNEPLEHRIAKLEKCCKNTVAAGKDLEKQVEHLAFEVQETSGRTRRADKFMDKLHDLV